MVEIFSWRELISREVRNKLDPVTAEFLDELENHFDFPSREICEDNHAWLASGIVSALKADKNTIEECNYLRDKLHLQKEMQKIHCSSVA